MKIGSLFGGKKNNIILGRSRSYSSTSEFVEHNLTDVKALLSSAGPNSIQKRLDDIGIMACCRVVLLAQKLQAPNKFVVVDSTDKGGVPRGTSFNWMHTQPIASDDAASLIDVLPFTITGGRAFISVPIKNERNMVAGVLIGISSDKIPDLDSRTRLMHLLAQSLEPEIRCYKLRQDIRQMEQRITSLNQNIEVRNADLKRAQESFIENKELKSIFLTNLSHEIRTPMNVIIGFIDLLAECDDADERRRFTELIKQSSEQMLCIIDNLIDISKLQARYMFKPQCPVQLNELLSSIKETYQKRLTEMNKYVQIETSFALETPNDTIWNSDEIIKKVLEQLMDNAIRYTHTGKITISYTMTHKDATFCVTDTGPGIRAGLEESIFNMFDLDTEINENQNGRGIGLALCKKYISLTNGDIWVDPEYKEGACFYFSIPTEKL